MSLLVIIIATEVIPCSFIARELETKVIAQRVSAVRRCDKPLASNRWCKWSLPEYKGVFAPSAAIQKPE